MRHSLDRGIEQKLTQALDFEWINGKLLDLSKSICSGFAEGRSGPDRDDDAVVRIRDAYDFRSCPGCLLRNSFFAHRLWRRKSIPVLFKVE